MQNMIKEMMPLFFISLENTTNIVKTFYPYTTSSRIIHSDKMVITEPLWEKILQLGYAHCDLDIIKQIPLEEHLFISETYMDGEEIIHRQELISCLGLAHLVAFKRVAIEQPIINPLDIPLTAREQHALRDAIDTIVLTTLSKV